MKLIDSYLLTGANLRKTMIVSFIFSYLSEFARCRPRECRSFQSSNLF